MSKSLKRVKSALETAGVPVNVLEMSGETRTAEQAAAQAGCKLDQIAKSIVFRGEGLIGAALFITAGGNQVDPALATELVGTPLSRADANYVREMTGFAIGGVAPIAHKQPPTAFFDPRLLDFAQVFAAAGTPRHIFSIAPQMLLELSQSRSEVFVSA